MNLCHGCQGDTFYLKCYIDNSNPAEKKRQQSEALIAGEVDIENGIPFGQVYCKKCAEKLFETGKFGVHKKTK